MSTNSTASEPVTVESFTDIEEYSIDYTSAGLPAVKRAGRFGRYPGQVPYWNRGNVRSTPRLDEIDDMFDSPTLLPRSIEDIGF